MLPGMELMGCQDLAVPAQVMSHVVRVESSGNPYAIGVVGTRLARQPRTSEEAVATARMLEAGGYNFSVGLAQVNRHNLQKYGLGSYETAFQPCPNLRAGSRILAECHARSGNDWGKAFSCYYSGNFTTGFRHGYVQRVFASMGLQTGPQGDPSADRALQRRRGGSLAPGPGAARTPDPTTVVASLAAPGAAGEVLHSPDDSSTPFVVRPSVALDSTAPAVAVATETETETETALPAATTDDHAFVF